METRMDRVEKGIEDLFLGIAELKKSQDRTDAAIQELREAQKKTDEQLRKTDSKNPGPEDQALACYPRRGINRKPAEGILSFVLPNGRANDSDLARRTRISLLD